MSKVEVVEEPRKLAVRVIKQNHLEIHYFIKPNTPMRLLKRQFARELAMDINKLCFLFGEHFVAFNDTAEKMGLRNLDVIRVFEIAVEQPGVYGVVQKRRTAE
ncbi:hypothetical protein GCK72_025455 [Caenorhabditis remanei]|uniref:Rad60/SUMO-like domain-containing protein n=1 Tax=Caenorhabditis remanei TaxID=31234 RepID=E3MJH9_CAERE|nr:hypothetical protein GCK72_025455 [Caenorhabditis remanei]EFP03627.1 hypothetical protein CRE_19218 [Caenorhabditis remanei]KAF1748988.1 hypothetical protein GCK72_025455 [Caenorhabditis remanei]